MRPQKEESDNIHYRYQKLIKNQSRKSVKQMVQEYEDNIIASPPEFRDDIIPPPLEFRDEIPGDEIRITFKGTARSYEVSIINDKDPLLQINGSKNVIESHLKELLVEMKSFKLYSTLKITFKKPQGNETYKSAYFNSKL